MTTFSAIDASAIGRRLVLAGAAVLPFSRLRAQGSGLVVRPEQFGAKGDGRTDDTAAFQKMAGAIQSRGGGTVILRNGATYRIGRQVRGGANDPAFVPQTMFSVSGVNGLTIEGNGATLKLNDGLRYGSFSPGGERFDPPRGKFTRDRYAANVGSMLSISNARAVRIRNLVLDGNMAKLVVGGRWGDVGIQLRADGLRLLEVSDVAVENVTSRNHGLDGVYLRGVTRRAAGTGGDSIGFSKLRCIGNGRQGVSIVGGSGIRFSDCLFADTAQGQVSSKPSAGVDIEPNGKDWASKLLFERCEFRNNRGVGLLADQGASRDIVARGCTFWQGFKKGGSRRGSGDAFWLMKPGVVVEDSQVHGNVTNLAPTSIVRRTSFDDAALSGYGHAAQQRRYLLDNASGLFEDCSFTVTAPGPHALVYAVRKTVFRRCRMRFAGQALPSKMAAAYFGNVTLENVAFTEALTRPDPAGNYIAADKTTTLRGTVSVSGPHVRWGNRKGATGNVAARGR